MGTLLGRVYIGLWKHVVVFNGSLHSQLSLRYFNNLSECLKRIRYFLSSPAVMGLPKIHLLWLYAQVQKADVKN